MMTTACQDRSRHSSSRLPLRNMAIWRGNVPTRHPHEKRFRRHACGRQRPHPHRCCKGGRVEGWKGGRVEGCCEDSGTVLDGTNEKKRGIPSNRAPRRRKAIRHCIQKHPHGCVLAFPREAQSWRLLTAHVARRAVEAKRERERESSRRRQGAPEMAGDDAVQLPRRVPLWLGPLGRHASDHLRRGGRRFVGGGGELEHLLGLLLERDQRVARVVAARLARSWEVVDEPPDCAGLGGAGGRGKRARCDAGRCCTRVTHPSPTRVIPWIS